MNRGQAIATIAVAGALAAALGTASEAADLGAQPFVKAPFAQPLYNWSGFYVGANFGGTTSSEDVTNGASFSTDPSGVLGGFQAGYNYQFSPAALVGVELELDWTSASGNTTFGVGGVGAGLTSNHNWYDTLDGRFGWVMGSWLLYVKGGIAWMNADYVMTATGAAVGSGTTNITRVGWNVGVGAEFMIAPQISAKAEYNFLDFGTDTVNFPLAIVGGTNVNTQVHEFKVGLNYHFAPGTLFGRW